MAAGGAVPGPLGGSATVKFLSRDRTERSQQQRCGIFSSFPTCLLILSVLPLISFLERNQNLLDQTAAAAAAALPPGRTLPALRRAAAPNRLSKTFFGHKANTFPLEKNGIRQQQKAAVQKTNSRRGGGGAAAAAPERRLDQAARGSGDKQKYFI